jgi:sugar O-acyltransferase (sialic acid O-acetyltransferase NeuD family)
MKPIVIIGGGGQAKVVISILKKRGDFRILGYVDFTAQGSILGVNYLGDDSILKELGVKHPECAAVIGIGSVEISDKRNKIKKNLESLGYDLPAVISPESVINEEVEIDKGTVICDGVIINCGSKIGEGVIINTRASVDHDCLIGDFVHIAPGAILCGGVEVGQNSIIAAGATVLQYKKIVKDCLIGAGAVVTEDCLESGTYLGIPAKRK